MFYSILFGYILCKRCLWHSTTTTTVKYWINRSACSKITAQTEPKILLRLPYTNQTDIKVKGNFQLCDWPWTWNENNKRKQLSVERALEGCITWKCVFVFVVIMEYNILLWAPKNRFVLVLVRFHNIWRLWLLISTGTDTESFCGCL